MRAVVLLLLGVNLVSASLHTVQYFYTATTGIENFPRFVDVGMLNGEQISMYDSTSNRKIPKQKWMEENLDQEYWDSSTKILRGAEEHFLHNIQVVMCRFNQSAGVHTFQRMYGCEWDDETGATNGFDMYGYDGEDFVSVDLKEGRLISTVPQGIITVVKWNKNRAFLELDKHYIKTVCIDWLKKYVEYGKSSLQKTVSPQVSLLQKDPSSPVTCHATGFYPRGIIISWMKNGQEHHEDVDLGELLPNEDGTFQRTSTISVTPDEWKKNKFICVVEHQGETISSILKEKKIRAKNETSVPIGIIGAVAAVILLVVIGVAGFMVYRKKKGFKPVEASDNSSNERITDTLISSGSGSSTSS
uniref:MHC class I antigen n=1 Tax=Ctenopharyngodon idella TaxID=7959 RepID=A0A6B9M1S2_CTEID|nr:MHC class I antigen [Ctenopharyngodon idella]